VEPDEGDLGRKESLARMRVFAAGSFANFVAAFCAGGLILAAGLWFSSVLVSDGMEVVATVEGYPAHGVLVVGDVIKSVDGRPTSDIEAFRGAVEPVKPGESVVVETDRGNFSLITTEFPGEEGNAYVGIEMVAHQKVAPDFEGEYRWLLPAFFFAVGCLYWTAFFNVNIAFVNLLPVVPFDGWRMLGEVLGSAGLGRGGVGGVSKDAVMVGVLLFTLLLFAVNVYPLLLMLG
jgi:membrane-associated protease RseP (regulator of RpoE activity)